MRKTLLILATLAAAAADVTINVISKPDGCDDPDSQLTFHFALLF